MSFRPWLCRSTTCFAATPAMSDQKSENMEETKNTKERKILFHECNMFCCEKSFATKRELNCHLGYHLGEKPFMCPECGLAYRYQFTMDAHMALKHNQDKEPKIKPLRGFACCNICLAYVPLREKRDHIKTHIPSYGYDDMDEDDYE